MSEDPRHIAHTTGLEVLRQTGVGQEFLLCKA